MIDNSKLLSSYFLFLTSSDLREWNETCSTSKGVERCLMKTRSPSAIAVNTVLEPETRESFLPRLNPSPGDLLARLDSALRTIRTLEQRVAMQERTYMAAMQEKNRKIRELQLRLQGRQ
jgi:hypothetical protein